MTKLASSVSINVSALARLEVTASSFNFDPASGLAYFTKACIGSLWCVAVEHALHEQVRLASMFAEKPRVAIASINKNFFMS